jgi:hypothetical protein
MHWDDPFRLRAYRPAREADERQPHLVALAWPRGLDAGHYIGGGGLPFKFRHLASRSLCQYRLR